MPDVPIDLPIEKRLAAVVAELGEDAVVLRALSLLAGNNEGEDFLLSVGGEHARGILDGAPVLYWPELWGTRALLYVWNDTAVEAVTAALDNQAWRVREMAARVAAVRGLAVEGILTRLLTDDVARVRAAAARALGSVGSDIDVLKPLLKDPDIDVRRGAQQAIDVLRKQKPAS
ncbi:MAG: HEAT repeat domain-containing protein [Salinibacterium sp.]|nr:HEAT repeat domain-containing protein [Salinibacterium sp.]